MLLGFFLPRGAQLAGPASVWAFVGAVLGLLALGAPIAAVTLGIVARKDPTIDQPSRNMALAGLVMGCISFGLFVVMLVMFLIVLAICAAACSNYHPCATHAVIMPGTCVAGRTRTRAKVPWREALAHHPDLPAFRNDVWRIGSWRLCVGCLTVFPMFLATLAALWLFPLGWQVELACGAPLALAQAVSSAGWTRWRWLKVLVKAATGVGLAALVHGVMATGLPEPAQSAIVAGLAGLAVFSTLPRARRIRQAVAASA
jgi:hypothetical protein